MTDAQIISKFLTRVSDGIKRDQKEKGMYTSGKSARSLKQEVKENKDTSRGVLRGAAYFQQQEEGRGPTPANARRSNPTLQEALLKFWIPFKSKFSSLSKDEKVSLSWAISKTIHQKGWDKSGNRIDTTEIIKEEKKILLSEAGSAYVSRFRSEIVGAFKDGS